MRDVRPLASGDAIGVGVFIFMIVCTICGYLAVMLHFTVAPALPPSRCYPIIAAVAVLVPTLAYLIGGLGFGAYTGWTGVIAALLLLPVSRKVTRLERRKGESSWRASITTS